MIRISVVLVAFLLAACGRADTDPPGAVVRDSAGVTIIEHAPADSAALPWWSLDPAPALDIGGAEVDEPYSLYQAGDAIRLADGGIVVANGGAADVRYYDARGMHRHTSGRRGDGPGEFQRPQRLFALAADSVLVVDAFGSRATVLDPEGNHARDFRLGGSGPGVGVAGRLRDGRLVGTRNEFTGGSVADGFQRPDVAFVLLTTAGEVLDTIVTLPGTERTVRIETRGGSVRSVSVMRPPFTKATVYAASGDVLVAATQEAPEIRVFGSDGALRRILRTGTPLAPVTDAHLDAWFERSREAMPPELRAQTPTRPDWPDTGTVVPPFDALALDDAGNLWAADYDDRIRTPNTWSVYEAEGRLLARIRMPARFRPTHMGTDFVLGVERDDLDVEHVRMYRIRKDR